VSKWTQEYSGSEGFVSTKDEGDSYHVVIGDSKTGSHDHYIYDKSSGTSRTIHRGQCDECSDKSGGK